MHLVYSYSKHYSKVCLVRGDVHTQIVTDNGKRPLFFRPATCAGLQIIACTNFAADENGAVDMGREELWSSGKR